MPPRIPYDRPFNATLGYKLLHPLATAPIRAYRQSAAYDLSACLATSERTTRTATISPRSTVSIQTGLALQAPPGHVILICSRSGLAKDSIFVTNAPGVIDPDYTGEIIVLLYNGGLSPRYIKNGERIAQALVLPFASLRMLPIEELPETERGEKGFGSSGR